MQQIKIFTSQSLYGCTDISVDEKVNTWLSENPQVRILDMRYQANVSGFQAGGGSSIVSQESVCLLYELAE